MVRGGMVRIIAVIAAAPPLTTWAQAPIAAEFTYQGRLLENGQPVSGTVDVSFQPFDAPTGGNPLTGGHFIGGVQVTGGLFTASVPFSAATDVQQWLEIGVNGTILSPRQKVTAAPYTQFSRNTRGINVLGDNVGVGTPLPQAKLQVVGEVRSDQVGFSARNPNNPGAIVRLDWDSDIPRIRFGGSGAGSQNGFDIQGTSNLSKLRILNDGKVGIGTPSPAAPLHILRGSASGVAFTHPNDYLIVEGGATANIVVALPENPGGASLKFARPSNPVAAQLLYATTTDVLSVHSSGSVYLAAGPSPVSDARVVVKNDGNVGIGTTNPTARLHVAGTAGVDGIQFPDGSLQRTAAVQILRTSVGLDVPLIAAGSGVTFPINVPGAQIGGVPHVSPQEGLPPGLVIAWSRVSAAGVVELRLENHTAGPINPPAVTWRVAVLP